MKIRVSIALATYNGEKFLLEQLHSLVKQTHQPDELIVFDDCSNDATVEILKKWVIDAPFPVTVVENFENLGYVQNFSNALTHCSGDIVFLCDQDDVWVPLKIEKILKHFELNPEIQLLIHDVEYCKENMLPIGQTKIDRMEQVFNLDHSYVVGMATAIRKPFLRVCLPIPNKFNVTHDQWLHQCASLIKVKMIVKDVLVLHRRHLTNVTVEGNLNVDFVTTVNHFKATLLERIQRIRAIKPKLKILSCNSLLTWLQDNRIILVKSDFINDVHIKSLIYEQTNKLDSINQRLSILSLPRWKRIIPVYRCYCKGYYDNFDGWKSIVGDLFLS